MRVLVTIPHFFRRGDRRAADGRSHGSVGRDPAARVRALTACVTALHQLFGGRQCLIDYPRRTTHPANLGTAHLVDVIVCTTGADHLLAHLPLAPGYIQHRPTPADPPLLGYECRAVLRDRLGRYDFFGYLEDDLILHDPWFFQKLDWFARTFGDENLLQPHRYEAAVNALVHRAYVDGDLRPDTTAPFQNVAEVPLLTAEVLGRRVEFRRTLNPHAGCYFLNARQLAHWARQPHFLERDTRFIGPLESAATLGVMRTFRVYKTALEHACFLEVEHAGTAFLDQIKPPPA